MMDDREEAREPSAGNSPEQVGRVNLDYDEADNRPVSRRDRIISILIAGILALLVMVGALLLILPGVYER